jgi:hypothetical protein
MTDCALTRLTLHAAALLLCRRYGLSQLVGLGGFSNTRQECSWRGFTLELDETAYPWGRLHELEAETVSRAELSCSCAGWARGLRQVLGDAFPLRTWGFLAGCNLTVPACVVSLLLLSFAAHVLWCHLQAADDYWLGCACGLCTYFISLLLIPCLASH